MKASQKLDALKKKFAHRDPTAAVYAGRLAIGLLFDHGGDSKRCAAKSASHQWIGDFSTRAMACAAITAHRAKSCDDSSCSAAASTSR
jgi:hypothetical protein